MDLLPSYRFRVGVPVCLYQFCEGS
jgi:hypothetical protein